MLPLSDQQRELDPIQNQVISISRISVHESPILTVTHSRHTVHIVLDSGATASLICAPEAERLKLKVWPTLHKAVQVDGVTGLKVLGEVHTEFRRGDLTLTFSALVVNKLGTLVLGGTNFLIDNDIYCRMANNTIVIKGNNIFSSTSAEILKMDQNSRPKLVKVERTQVILNGEYVECSLPPECPPNGTFFLDPRYDGTFSSSPQVVTACDSKIRIENKAPFPVKLKKHTPLAQIRFSEPFPSVVKSSCSFPDKYTSYFQEPLPPISPHKAPDLQEVVAQINFNNTPANVKQQFSDILAQHLDVFDSSLPGYNNHFGPVYATIQFGSRARPPPHKTRLPSYGSHGQKLASQKVLAMIKKGVLVDPYTLGIQPALVNDSWVVKKPAFSKLSWDQCEEKHVRLVTAFDGLNKFLKQIPPKTSDPMLIYTHLSNWTFLGELDFSDMYWQLKFNLNNNQQKSQLGYLCIRTIFGTYAYARGPMGLLGMDAVQEELTDRVFGDLVLQGKVVKHADNLYFGGTTQEDFMQVFQEILTRCQISDLRLKASKINLNIQHADILGLHWNNGTLTTSAHKLDPLSTCERPNTVKGLRSFLGAVRFYEICLPSKELAAVTELLDKQIPSSRSGKDVITWDEELCEKFTLIQSILKRPEVIYVPRRSDSLYLCSDGALSGPALGVKLLIKREGHENFLPSFNYGFRVKSSMLGWSPCEFEAYSLVQGIKKMKPFLRYVDNPSTALVDSKAVVEAIQRMERGLFSSNRRLQDLLANISSERLKVLHMSAKIASPILQLVDFGSRHPVECNNIHCTICIDSKNADTTFFGQVQVEDLKSPHVSLKMWIDMQKSSKDCQRAAALIQSGKLPHRKEIRINDLREYLRKCTLNKSGLLVTSSSNTTHPFQDAHVERIVVPQEFAFNFLTLFHKKCNHPSVSQLLKLFNRQFFALHIQQLIKQVTDACDTCAAMKAIPMETLQYSTPTKPSTVGSFFNADVLVESCQKILVIRDNLTSFTDAMFVPNEQKSTLRDALVVMVSKLRSTKNVVIRTDPHSSLKSLAQDKSLSEENIILELGSPKNVNKNAVAEKAIQELRREILSLSPEGNKISELTLAKALLNLNTRIRHTGRSSRELWLRRDQFTGEPLNFHDHDISNQQFNMRQSSHESSAKYASRHAPPVQLPQVHIGDQVYVKSDKSKSKCRDPFFVVGKDKDSVSLQKLSMGKNRHNIIPVSVQNIYKSPSSRVVKSEQSVNTETANSKKSQAETNRNSVSNSNKRVPPKLLAFEDSDSSSDEDIIDAPSSPTPTPTLIPPPFPVAVESPRDAASTFSPNLSPKSTRVEVNPFSPGPAFSHSSLSESSPNLSNKIIFSPSTVSDNSPTTQEDTSVNLQTPEASSNHFHKDVWLTPKGTLSPRDRRALRSSAKNNHSSKLPDGSLIFRGKRLIKKKCSLCD